MKKLLIACAICVLAAQQCAAAIVFDSGGFEAYNSPAALVGQFGWQDFNSPNGNRFNVQSAITQGGSANAVSVTGSSDVGGFVAPAVNYTPTANELVLVEVDIARTIGQIPSSPSSDDFSIGVYETGTDFPTIGFGLGVNLANNAIVPFANAGGGLIPLTEISVASREFVNFRAELDYTSNTFRLFVNGVDVRGALPFINGASNMGDADLVHSPTINALDVGYFDNYRISTQAVPEPGSAMVAMFAFAGVLGRRRRR